MFVVDLIPDSICSSKPIPARPQARLANFWLVGVFIVLALISCSLQAAEERSSAATENLELVYLNTATAQELQERLIGVGQRRAEAIVAYRERVGDFRNDEELSQVRGIRPNVLSANKTRISNAPSGRPAAANSRAAKRSLAEKINGGGNISTVPVWRYSKSHRAMEGRYEQSLDTIVCTYGNRCPNLRICP